MPSFLFIYMIILAKIEEKLITFATFPYLTIISSTTLFTSS